MKAQFSLGRIFIAAILLLLVLPLFCVMVFFLFTTFNAAKASITGRINTVSRALASQTDAKIGVPFSYLVSMAEMAGQSGAQDPHIGIMLSSGIKSYRIFETLYVLSSDKTVKDVNIGRASNYDIEDIKGIRLTGIKDIPGTKTVWSRPMTSMITNSEIVRIAIKFNGGYIVGDISLNSLSDSLRAQRTNNYSSTVVINSLGDIIASDNPSYLTDNIGTHPLMNIRQTGYHVLFGYKSGGTYMVGAIHPIPSCDWSVIYEEPIITAFLYYKEILVVTIISLIFLVMFTTIVLFFIKKRLIEPLHLLTQRSEMISKGDFVSFSNTDKKMFRELSALYDSFEQMAITIDKREKELKDKEEYLRSVFDSTTSTGLLIISMDQDPVINDANMGAQTIFGYRLTEILGLPVPALIKNLGSDLSLMCGKCRDTGRMVTDTVEMVKKDGSIFPVLASISPLYNFNGKLQGFIGVFIDITEITRVKNELEGEKERLDVTLKSIGEGVVAADSRERVILVNSSAEQILGQKTRFLTGHNINDVLQIYDYDTGRLMTDRITDFSLTDSKTYRANMVTQDSGIITVYITSSAMKNAKGDIMGSVYVFRDITDRMQMEQELVNRKRQLEEINRNLEIRISDETEKRRKNEQMLFEQAKFAAMGQMISAIAHQWRQPLNALGLYVQDIEDAHESGEADKEYFDNFIDNAMKLIDHMSTTIDDFRNFFHSANILEESDVTSVLIDSMSLVTTQLRSHMVNYKITVRSGKNSTVYDNQLPEDHKMNSGKKVMIYPSELKQVILNIVQNARYAIEDFRKQKPDVTGLIDITLNYGKDRLRLDIENNGGSIPEDIIGRVFDPYFTTKQEGEGTGIGLYMSKIMIEDHMNGLLTVENVKGGVRFTITLSYGSK